jgi:hypothetical protein
MQYVMTKGETKMKAKVSNAAAVIFSDAKYVTESDFDVPEGWTLFDREQVDVRFSDGRTETLFCERWVEPTTGKGLVVSKMIGDGSSKSLMGNVYPEGAVYLTVEEYLHPVDVESFKPSSSAVKRAEFQNDATAYTAVTKIMEGLPWEGRANRVVVAESPMAAIRTF